MYDEKHHQEFTLDNNRGIILGILRLRKQYERGVING